LTIPTCLGKNLRILNIFYFGPKLAEIRHFFMLFVVKRILLMCKIKIFWQGSQQFKFVFCSSQAMVEYPFFLKLSLNLPGRFESGDFFLSILNAFRLLG
jgi:hypothetical protein